MMPNPIDMTGKRYGRLVALEFVGRNHLRKRLWRFRCDCGTEKPIVAEAVRSGLVVSCGCYNADLARRTLTTHGRSRSKEHLAWKGAKTRCYNPHYQAFHRYGGRGISMCERWRNSFEAFFEDMGFCPPGLTLERINNDRGYEPGNCKWATKSEQARNRAPRRTNPSIRQAEAGASR